MLAVNVLLVPLGVSGWGERLQSQTSRRLEFFLRSALGRDPPLSGKLKVFVYDDDTVAHFHAAGPSLGQWARMVDALGQRSPRAVIIDKLFDLPEASADFAGFVTTFQNIGAPVYAGAFTAPSPIVGRAPLSPDAVATPPRNVESFRHGKEFGYVYAAPPFLWKAFRSFGHVNYSGDGFVAPFVDFGESSALPHLAFAGTDVFLRGSRDLVVDGKTVPTDPRGRILVDVGDVRKYQNHTFGMKSLMLAADAGKPVSVVDAGDTVLLLPAMYTGHGDWVDTPKGPMPGGYVLMAMVNSVLTGEWLAPFSGWGALTILASLVGAAIACWLWSSTLWLALLGAVAATALTGLATFVTRGVSVPWLFPDLALGVTALALFVQRIRVADREQVRIEREVETARLVQAMFFPAQPLELDGLVVEASVLAASECSGDWWGHCHLGPGRDLIAICDAVGHGVSAALLTAAVQSTFLSVQEEHRDHPELPLSPARLLVHFNKVIFAITKGLASVTMFCAVLDQRRRQATFANAGHNLPFLLPRDVADARLERLGDHDGSKASYVSLRSRGDPLGCIQDMAYQEGTLPLVPGDRLVFYTDGLIEGVGEGGAPYGLKRVVAAVLSAGANPNLSGLLSKLLADNRSFRRGRPQDDDITVVMVEVTS